MTRAADFPHNIPTDSLGLLAREPRAKTGEELRQETVYDIVREVSDFLLGAYKGHPDDTAVHAVLAVICDRASAHEVTRPISNAIHDALAVTREEKREESTRHMTPDQIDEMERFRRFFAGSQWSPEERAVLQACKAGVEASFEDARVTHVLTCKPEETEQILANMVVTTEALDWTTDNTPAQPSAQAPKVEEWMKADARHARKYQRGMASLSAVMKWDSSVQGFDYWSAFSRLKYEALPQEARDYIDLIASADGGK